MEPFNIFITSRAQKDLTSLTQNKEEIINGIVRLKTNSFPDGKHIKKLKGYEGLYRLRVGDYRIVFKREGKNIYVVSILTRQDFEKVY